MKQSPWITAFKNPLNLIMLGTSLAAGLISAWWLFPIGLIFWLFMLAKIALDPGLRIAQTIQERNSLPQRFEPQFNRVERTQVKLYNSLSSVKPSIKNAFEPLQQAVDELADQTYQLCLQMTPLENFRQVNANSDPDKELNQLNRLLDSIEDPDVKRSYDKALSVLQEKVNQNKLINDRLNQMDAILISAATVAEGLIGDSIQLQVMQINGIKPKIEELVNQANQEIGQIKNFSKQLSMNPIEKQEKR